MKVLIIEDEQLAARRIEGLIRRYDAAITIMGIIDSVSAAVRWLQENDIPDLVFMDIQLADGLSFNIFEKINLSCPIIFTTAYQEYAVRAFKLNSVDYLLKPIDFDEFRHALDKYRSWKSSGSAETVITKDLLDSLREMTTRKYKSRFGVKTGEHIKSIPVEEILYFYSLQKGTFLYTKDHHTYLVDYPLDTVTEMIDPDVFFRINRKYLVRHEAILDIISYSASRLKIKIMFSDDNEILVSRERVPYFKKWLDR